MTSWIVHDTSEDNPVWREIYQSCEILETKYSYINKPIYIQFSSPKYICENIQLAY